MKLSVCMILKNEGPTIYRCLESLVGLVDEWIIGIDDSTKDNTEDEVNKFFQANKELAKSSILYDFKWSDHFGNTRNDGMDKATGDYILIMDGHEYFPEDWFNITQNKRIQPRLCFDKIRGIIEKDEPDEAFFQLYQQPFIGESPTNYFLQPRIYRNGLGKDGKNKIRFNRAAHNTITNTDTEKHLHFTEIMIIHDAPEDNRKERKEQRIRINVTNLTKDIKKNPKDTRAMFYLGNTYMEAKEWNKAIDNFNGYLENRKDDNSEKYQVLVHKSLCHKELKEYDEMKTGLHMAIKIDPKRRDAYCILGDHYYQEENYSNAIHFYSSALIVKPKESRMFSNGPVNSWQPHQNIARAYAKVDNIQQAITHLKIAYSFMPNQGYIDQIKEWSGDKRNIWIIDKIGSFTKDFREYLDKRGYNVITTKEFDGNLALWADYIWQEWCDENAVHSSKTKKATIRIHGYEAYLNQHLFSKIDWNNNKVIFVAKHIQEMMKPFVNGNGSLIHNGVDIDKFYIKNKKRDEKSVGYAGFINEKKNPYLLLKVIQDNPEYKFHLRVDWQSPFWEYEFKRHDLKNVVYHARYDDLNDFWNQMSMVLSTSIIESFSYNIAEAMSAGCKPYIYNWNGSRDIWKEDWIFEDMPKFDKVEDRQQYRDYIISNYNLAGKLPEMEKVLIK